MTKIDTRLVALHVTGFRGNTAPIDAQIDESAVPLLDVGMADQHGPG